MGRRDGEEKQCVYVFVCVCLCLCVDSCEKKVEESDVFISIHVCCSVDVYTYRLLSPQVLVVTVSLAVLRALPQHSAEMWLDVYGDFGTDTVQPLSADPCPF